MNKLLKILNKFNGNICFIGATDSGDYVFECDHKSGALSYDSSSKLITDVCLNDSVSYIVTFGDQWLGRYFAGSLTEAYHNTGLSRIDKVEKDTDDAFYFLDKVNNNLIKYKIVGGTQWSCSLPDNTLSAQGNIYFRESDGVILYYNNSNIHVIRDDSTNGTLINSVSISGSGSISVESSNNFSPSYDYVRVRTVTGSQLDQSSSSSSS